MDTRFDLIIIGSGPAGMTAAIYGSRAGLKTAMIESMAPGGKLVKTDKINNWPGVVEINGAELAFQMYEHSTAFFAESLFHEVQKITKDQDMFLIECADGACYQATAVIVASGTRERVLNIANEERMTGKGVSYCAVCDGAFFKNEIVTVIGGGNSALEEAMYLTNFAREVNIVIRRDVFRADRIIQDKVLKNPRIHVIKEHVPTEIVVENDKVAGLVLRNVKTDELTTLPTKGIFPYIGSVPNTDMIRDFDVTDPSGYIIVDETMASAVEGLFAAGDVVVKRLRQVVTAASDGAIAAQAAFHYIRK